MEMSPTAPTLAELFSNDDIEDHIVSNATTEMSGSNAEQARPFSFVLSFKNLSYIVNVHQNISFTAIQKKTSGRKVILDNISGEARDGEILAVLGSSGSGKSTLLDALAGRISKGSLKGTVTLNGEHLEKRLAQALSAYVMQDDLLFPMLTVEETLMFAAELRFPQSLSKSSKSLRVQSLIDQLDLRNASNTIIGNEGHRGVSGGERRRVSIGTDIIHNPILLYLDEPTSGLDSTSAYKVVKVLSRIAQSGSTVIMSIHQPSSRILSFIDQMLILSKGELVYNGTPSNLPQFFADFGHPLSDPENQIEMALDLIREVEDSSNSINSIAEFYQLRFQISKEKSILSLKEAITASTEKGKLVSSIIDKDGNPSTTIPTFGNPFWAEVAILSSRSFTNSRRMPEIYATRLNTVLITSFIIGTLFWKLDGSPMGVRERLCYVFYAIFTIFQSCTDILSDLVNDRYIFMRETAYNTYRRSSYVLSYTLMSLPSLAFLSLVFSGITFLAVGLDGGLPRFLFYYFTIFSCYWTGNSFVVFVSGFTTQLQMSYVMCVAGIGYYCLFSGFYGNRDRIPSYWIWYHYVSLVKYPYEAILQNEFQDPKKCYIKGVQMFDNTLLAKLPAATKTEILQTLGMNLTSTTCVITGKDVLKNQEITELSKWNCVWVILAWGVLFRILFYLTLLWGSKNRRR